MKSRDYQQDAFDSVHADWARGVRGTLVVLATALGKTVVGSKIAASMPAASILVVVPNEEIMGQFAAALARATGQTVGKIGAGHKDHKERRDLKIYVGIVNSLTRLVEFWQPDRFSHVFYDEAHHSVAATYLRIAERFKEARLLGLTATPWRGDGKGLLKLFDNVCVKRDAIWGVENGWLTPIESFVRTTQDMDMSRVRVNLGDFNKKEMRQQLQKQQVVDFIARQTMDVAENRQSVVFCATIEQSRAVNRVLRQMGVVSAHIDGKTEKWVRRDNIGRFRNGDLQVITNVGVIEEGVDVPGIEVVTMASPTKSKTKFIQRAGRGLRPVEPPQGKTPEERRKEISDSVKPSCRILDITGNMGRHSMRFSGDLLFGEIDDLVRRIAIELVQHVKGVIDWTAIMAEATKIAAERQAAEMITHRDRNERSEEYNWCSTHKPCPYDVLEISREDAEEVTATDSHGGNHAKVYRYLTEEEGGPQLSRREIQHLTNKQQVYLARVYWHRVHPSKRGATYKQSRLVWLHGYRAATLTTAQASHIIRRLSANGRWLRPEEDGPNKRWLEWKNSLNPVFV